jgi:hypothetical protein
MRTLLLAAAALAAPAAHAQLIPSASFGVTAGVNFASLSDAGSRDLDNSTGYHAGLYADLGVGGLSIRPAILYVAAGDIDVVPGGTEDGEGVDYVSIPVDLQLSLPTPLVQPYAIVGPEFRFPQGDIEEGEVNTRDFSLAANAGLGVELGGFLLPNAFAEVRYGLDISGLLDEEDGSAEEEFESVKVNLVMIRVGVGI